MQDTMNMQNILNTLTYTTINSLFSQTHKNSDPIAVFAHKHTHQCSDPIAVFAYSDQIADFFNHAWKLLTTQRSNRCFLLGQEIINNTAIQSLFFTMTGHFEQHSDPIAVNFYHDWKF